MSPFLPLIYKKQRKEVELIPLYLELELPIQIEKKNQKDNEKDNEKDRGIIIIEIL